MHFHRRKHNNACAPKKIEQFSFLREKTWKFGSSAFMWLQVAWYSENPARPMPPNLKDETNLTGFPSRFDKRRVPLGMSRAVLGEWGTPPPGLKKWPGGTPPKAQFFQRFVLKLFCKNNPISGPHIIKIKGFWILTLRLGLRDSGCSMTFMTLADLIPSFGKDFTFSFIAEI